MSTDEKLAAAVEVLKDFEAAFGAAVDNDEDINGGDAVEFIGNYLDDVRATLKRIQS